MKDQFPVNYPEMVIEKSQGFTLSEKRLITLSYNTFLQLWSFPNPYKVQAGGKELCDLLVVFNDHILIFSDKDCIYGSTDNEQVDWRRWYKKAIQKSAEQLLGAKKWIERYPDKISLDAKGEKRLPLNIRITPATEFHLIAIAHGAASRCKEYFSGGNGGLIIDSHIKGNMHVDENCKPFQVGIIEDSNQNFIHVFDDASYATILTQLDTIQDFVQYLINRKKILLKKHVLAPSENEILAHHVNGLMYGNESLLGELCQQDDTFIVFEEGQWDALIQSQEYFEWRTTMKRSYFLDALLKKTFYLIEHGQLEMTSSPTVDDQSRIFCQLARMDRRHRYAFSDGLISFFQEMPADFRGTRIIYEPDVPDVCYILFLLPKTAKISDEEYRERRRNMLQDYCRIVKTDFPRVLQVIGIAHESSDTEYSSEDFIYLDASIWSDEDQKEALRLKKEYQSKGLLRKQQYITKTYFGEASRMKGRDRNKPCPCGSGRKYKHCCGCG